MDSFSWKVADVTRAKHPVQFFILIHTFKAVSFSSQPSYTPFISLSTSHPVCPWQILKVMVTVETVAFPENSGK
jgi:hypothetical protein